MAALLLRIDLVVGLVKAGISSVGDIVKAIRDGRAKVTDAAGAELTAEQVEAACDAAKAEALREGDAAAGRIDARNPDPGVN